MGKYMKKVIGIACLSLSFQAAVTVVKAQDLASTTPQTQSSKSSTALSPLIPDLSTQIAMITRAADNLARSEAKPEPTVEAGTENAIAGPNILPKNPSIDLRITAQDSKINTRPFPLPDLAVLGQGQDFRATAYALRGQTRTGVYVRRGVVAADPRVIPLGSVLEIKAGKYSGVYTVHDTGKSIKGKIIDLWVPTTYEARQFGRRQVKLHILRYGFPNQAKSSTQVKAQVKKR
ncbi:MAG TPA: 3D domain-containing protein [Blastocatellia bacterium]|nr:3D domain-containing protein [Blastocatellia bacterium]